MLSKSGAEGQSRTDTGSPPAVFEYHALCTNQFHHETYSIIGSLVVLAGVGPSNQERRPDELDIRTTHVVQRRQNGPCLEFDSPRLPAH